MGAKAYFNKRDLRVIGEALDISEDCTGGFFKFSSAQWKRHRYCVKTLEHLNEHEIAPLPAFAYLHKYSPVGQDTDSRSRMRDNYCICLQDHQIIKALRRDKELHMLPLMVYVFTHELIHIVRFCNYYQRFEVKGHDRDREEGIVHQTSLEALKGLKLQKLDYILEAYRPHSMPESMAF